MDENVPARPLKTIKEKVEFKLSLLKNYYEDDACEFELPKKFSYNWFYAWKDEAIGAQPFSKGGKLVRNGTELHATMMTALKSAQRHLISKKEAGEKYISDNEQLKSENAKLNNIIRGLGKDIIELKQENARLTLRLGVEEARNKDASERNIAPISHLK